MSGAQRKQLRKCESKKKFFSLSEANRFIELLEKNGPTKDKLGMKRPMRAYICKICRKIHIGHIPMDEFTSQKKNDYKRRD